MSPGARLLPTEDPATRNHATAIVSTVIVAAHLAIGVDVAVEIGSITVHGGTVKVHGGRAHIAANI